MVHQYLYFNTLEISCALLFKNISSINNLISIFQGLQGCDPPCRNGGTCEEDTCLCVEFGQPGDENYWKYEGNDCSIGM